MAYNDLEISEPVPFPRSFEGKDECSLISQAAFLLALGVLIRSEWRETFLLSPEDQKFFPLLSFNPLEGKISLSRVAEEVAEFDLDIADTDSNPEVVRKAARFAAIELKEHPEATKAGTLLAIALRSPVPLVSTCAAISLVDIMDDVTLAMRKLYDATLLPFYDLARELALTYLNRLFHGSQQGAASALSPPLAQIPVKTNSASHGCVVIHGTFPYYPVGTPVPAWWNPSGDFHKYLAKGPRSDVYTSVDYFRWEGGYSDHARETAAHHLQVWQTAHDLGGMDVIAHSHGGNMAMLATHFGTKIRKLVLLSCPVHSQTYYPDIKYLEAAQSIRIKLDLVILADRGAGQRFALNSINEDVLPIWFVTHGTTHKPSTWQSQSLNRHV